MRSLLTPTLTCLFTALAFENANAYYPLNCFPKTAQEDYPKADLVVVGRVSKTERYKTPLTDRSKEEYVFYLATITVGACLKGTAKTGDDILMQMGGYLQRQDDDTKPTFVRTHNTHGAWLLKPDGVYLLFLDKAPGRGDEPDQRDYRRKGGTWKETDLRKATVFAPRSCHFSIHEVSVVNRKVGEPVETEEPGIFAQERRRVALVTLALGSDAKAEMSDFLEWRKKGLSIDEQMLKKKAKPAPRLPRP